MTEQTSKDPLHGVTLEMMLTPGFLHLKGEELTLKRNFVK